MKPSRDLGLTLLAASVAVLSTWALTTTYWLRELENLKYFWEVPRV